MKYREIFTMYLSAYGRMKGVSMRNIKGLFLIVTTMMLMSGCSKSCKADGCTMAIFKEDVCVAHYTVIPGSSEAEEPEAQETAANGMESTSGGTQELIGDPAVDFKGDYQLEGEEYVWVDTYYMRDQVLYIEGTYCDGVWNPDAEVAGDSMTFTTIKEHVTIMMDAETRITLEGCKDLKDVTSWIDRMAAEFGETAVAVKLDGAHVTEFSGTWQWS